MADNRPPPPLTPPPLNTKKKQTRPPTVDLVFFDFCHFGCFEWKPKYVIRLVVGSLGRPVGQMGLSRISKINRMMTGHAGHGEGQDDDQHLMTVQNEVN